MRYGAQHSSTAPAASPFEPPARSTGSPGKYPYLSVVVPAYNEARCISSTLESVFRAKTDYPGLLEIIVVDNNSSDTTAAIARSFGVTLVFEPINQIARARNAGAAVASGDLLVFLDADTRIEGDILHRVAECHRSGMVIGGGAWAEMDSGGFGRLLFDYVINPLLGLAGVTPGPFLFCDRAAFQTAGGFDESLYAAEEFSLARRLRALGCADGRRWAIIAYGGGHRVVTSGRKLRRFGGLEMLLHNLHLLWRPRHKLRMKTQCRFWYEPVNR